MTELRKINHRERKRKRSYKKKTDRIRSTIRLTYEDKRTLLKKTGKSLQESIEKLVKEFIQE